MADSENLSSFKEEQQNQAKQEVQLGKAEAHRSRQQCSSAKVKVNKGPEEFAQQKYKTEAIESYSGPAVILHTDSTSRSAVHQRKKPKAILKSYVIVAITATQS